MKITLYRTLLLLLVLLNGQIFAQSIPTVIEINNGWEFHKVGTNNWYKAEVPGCVHTDLINNKLIPDPYFGENEAKLQWIDKTSWEYKTTFIADKSILEKQNIELDFKGLDTYAEVSLNGQHLLTTDNMFCEWQTNIKSYLKEGENTLRILFHSPVVMALLSRDKFNLEAPMGYNFEFMQGELPNYAPYWRKAGYMNGWDWGPKLTTSGIWRPVYLRAWDNAKINSIQIVQKEITKQKATINTIVAIESSAAMGAILNMSYSNNGNIKKVTPTAVKLQQGLNEINIDITIDKPAIWWPNGLGEQPLYEFVASLDINSTTADLLKTKTGLRTVKLIREPEADGGTSFYFEVNGNPVFAKGANYIPSDVFPSRVTPEHYEGLIKAAADANMNMLRVWGGGIYESDLFYELCDQYGIMIWQDFAFAIYHTPDYPEFMASIQKELKDNIQRLRNHPSIVLWCGNNETELIWDMLMKKYFGYKIDDKVDNLLEYLIPIPPSGNVDPAVTARVEKAYDDIFYNYIPEAIEKYDYNSHDYWPSSPMSDYKTPMSQTKPQSGDMHFYIAMLDLPFSAYLETPSHFFSEHGFHAWPDKKTVYGFTSPEDRKIDSPVMKAHIKEMGGSTTINNFIEKYYGTPKDFDSYLYLSQVQQAEGMKLALETHRRWMPYTMGTLYWQLNDVWPGATWASIDYLNNLKPLHYFVKKAFEPLIVVPSNHKNEFKITIVSEEKKAFNAKLEMQIIDFNGKKLWEQSKSVSIKPNTSEVFFETTTKSLVNNIDTAQSVFVVKLVKGKKILASNVSYFVIPKELKLQKPTISKEIKTTEGGFTITLKSKTLVKNLYLNIAEKGLLSDNFFDLLPGEEVSIQFLSEEKIKNFGEKVNLFSLIDAN